MQPEASSSVPFRFALTKSNVRLLLEMHAYIHHEWSRNDCRFFDEHSHCSEENPRKPWYLPFLKFVSVVLPRGASRRLEYWIRNENARVQNLLDQLNIAISTEIEDVFSILLDPVRGKYGDIDSPIIVSNGVEFDEPIEKKLERRFLAQGDTGYRWAIAFHAEIAAFLASPSKKTAPWNQLEVEKSKVITILPRQQLIAINGAGSLEEPLNVISVSVVLASAQSSAQVPA